MVGIIRKIWSRQDTLEKKLFWISLAIDTVVTGASVVLTAMERVSDLATLFCFVIFSMCLVTGAVVYKTTHVSIGYFFSEVIYKNSEITERETFSDEMKFDEAQYYWVGMRRKYVAMSVQFDSPVPAKVKGKHIAVPAEGKSDPGTYSLSIADDIRSDSVAYSLMVLPLQWDEVEALGQGYEKIIVTGSKWFPGSSV